MAMLVDLQRCRRMVASMRGLVVVSSLRLQLFKDAHLALTKREERVRETQEMAARRGEAPLSPRAHYMRDFRGQRVRVIQRQWRKHRWQRVIVEKIKLERKWRAKRGNKRMELSATTIQRVFRGHCVRKKRKGKPQLSLLATVVLAQLRSRLERLHTTRRQYIKRLGSRRHALEQAHRDLELALHDKATTEEKIAKAETTNGASGKTASLFVDATLLDGTVVRMEAHQLLAHQVSEITRLEETLVHLEREIQELESSDPIVHQAAKSIQEVFRRYRERKRDELDRKRQRIVELRRRISSERCYERMNAGFLQRQRDMRHCKTLILDGLYHIIVAKRLRQHYREKRAVAVIERIYTQRLDRADAQRRLEWRRAKLRAELFVLKRGRRSLIRVWQHWQAEVAFQRQRRVRIPQVLASGHATWITTKAIRLQRVFLRAMALRRCLDDQVLPVLHPGLRHTIESAVASSTSPRDQFLQFYQRVTQTMHAWRVPTKHLYSLAQRYTLPLDALPLDEIWTWLLSQPQQHHDAQRWFLDLRQPFPIRTLRFLAPLSRFFDLYDRISYQEEQIWIHYEARRCVREYLVLLSAHDAVAYKPATTFSAHQRQCAMTTLRRLMQDDDQHSSDEPQWMAPCVSAFTQFHCVWTDLCEQCLAMQPSAPPARACASCGHRHIEKSTAAQASHAAVAQPLDGYDNQSSLPQWIRASERCDFLVLNAFFHALAPRGHVHRELYAPDTLWKIALAKALEPVTALYEQFGIRTLNDLLIAETDTLAQALPSPVTSKLGLFIRLIKQELLELVANPTERGTRA